MSFFKKLTEVSFSGKIIGQEQGKLKNGKREGCWKIYDRNGRIRGGDFQKGEEDSPRYQIDGHLVLTFCRTDTTHRLWV